MKDVIFLLIHLLTTIANLIQPGGSRTLVAENLLLKRQLIIHSRSRQRAPNLTTLGHTKDSLWSVDLFRCESITLKTHWVMAVMDQYTRRIIDFGVHAGNVDGPTLCRMFNDATSGQGWPERISSDNDPLFQYHRWKANLRVLEIEEIKSLPHVPMSHPFVERLIGSVRRALLDHTLFWTATDLENKLRDYQAYYNGGRTHSLLDGVTPMKPEGNQVVDLNDYRWKKYCRGLFQLPVAA